MRARCLRHKTRGRTPAESVQSAPPRLLLPRRGKDAARARHRLSVNSRSPRPRHGSSKYASRKRAAILRRRRNCISHLASCMPRRFFSESFMYLSASDAALGLRLLSRFSHVSSFSPLPTAQYLCSCACVRCMANCYSTSFLLPVDIALASVRRDATCTMQRALALLTRGQHIACMLARPCFFPTLSSQTLAHITLTARLPSEVADHCSSACLIQSASTHSLSA